MDTKEKRVPRKRKKPAQSRRTPQNTSAAQRRRRAAAAASPRRRPARKQTVRTPREDIPNAVYTMPKPIQKGKLLLRLATVAAVVVALMLVVSIFFKVETVEVLGAEKYTAWAVSEASGIQVGDGLLTLSRGSAAGKIKSALPYVDEVKVDIKLPGTVRIEITELQVTYAVASEDNSWWLISVDGEAIEQVSATVASGYTRLLGVTIQAPAVGQSVAAAKTAPAVTEATEQTDDSQNTMPPQAVETPAQRLAAALTILASLEDNGVIGEVAFVNVQSLTDIQVQYGERFDVRLGNEENLSYKVTYMAQAIRQMENYQIGVLDVSFEFSDEGIFTPTA